LFSTHVHFSFILLEISKLKSYSMKLKLAGQRATHVNSTLENFTIKLVKNLAMKLQRVLFVISGVKFKIFIVLFL